MSLDMERLLASRLAVRTGNKHSILPLRVTDGSILEQAICSCLRVNGRDYHYCLGEQLRRPDLSVYKL